MSTMRYKVDALVRLLQTMESRQGEEELFFADENVTQDVFFPISEQVALADTVEVHTFNVAEMVWGNGTTVESKWVWGYGGKWR